MKTILLITGNQHKLAEWQRMMPDDITLESIDIDLEEIQSADPTEIVIDKVKKAYAAVGKPVIVEDVSAGLDKWGGLPGPFIKFFMKTLGQDALFQLANNKEGEPATVSCTAAYYDGETLLSTQGIVEGTIVAPRGESFGFDVVFVPNGYDQTYAEMPRPMKDSMSHRSIAMKELLRLLEENNLA